MPIAQWSNSCKRFIIIFTSIVESTGTSHINSLKQDKQVAHHIIQADNSNNNNMQSKTTLYSVTLMSRLNNKPRNLIKSINKDIWTKETGEREREQKIWSIRLSIYSVSDHDLRILQNVVRILKIIPKN